MAITPQNGCVFKHLKSYHLIIRNCECISTMHETTNGVVIHWHHCAAVNGDIAEISIWLWVCDQLNLIWKISTKFYCFRRTKAVAQLLCTSNGHTILCKCVYSIDRALFMTDDKTRANFVLYHMWTAVFSIYLLCHSSKWKKNISIASSNTFVWSVELR